MKSFAACFFSIVILFSLGCHATWAKPRGQKKTPISRYLVAFRGDGPQYKDCSRTMKGHKGGSTEIRICLLGNGTYWLNSIDVLEDTDWFPASRFIANQVGAIHVLCSEASTKESFNSRTLFPDRKEAYAGKKVLIEVPCGLSPDGMRALMEANQEMILWSIHDPEKLFENTDQVQAACIGIGASTSEGCQSWKKDVGDLFSGEALKRLEAPTRTCDVPVEAGLTLAYQPPKVGWAAILEKVKDPFDLSNYIDMETPLTDNDPRFHQLSDFVDRLVPACRDSYISVAREKETELILNPDFPFDECLSQLPRLREYLVAKGVKFLPDGSAKVGDESPSIKAFLDGIDGKYGRQWHSPLAQIAEGLMWRTNGAGNAGAKQASQLRQSALDFQNDQHAWEATLANTRYSTATIDGFTESGHLSYGAAKRADANETCGMDDVGCAARFDYLWHEFERQAKEALTAGRKISKVKRVYLSSSGKIIYDFE